MSHVSRRTVLRTGATLVVAGAFAALLPEDAFAVTTASARQLPMTRDAFEQLLGTTLRMRGNGSAYVVTVVSVDDIKPASATGDRHRFAVTFRGSRRHVADQGVYTLSAAGRRGFDLLVVPVDRGVAARHYQAVINRSS
jgi:hypothetical protein